MPPPLFTLDRPSLEILRRMVHDEMRRTKVDLSHASPREAVPPGRTYVAYSTTLINPGTVTTPDSGTAALMRFDSSAGSDLSYVTDATNTVTVWNMGGTIPQGHTMIVTQDTAGVFWVLHPQIHTRYRGQLQGALASGDSTKVVDNLVLVSGFDWGISSLTAYNVCAWAAADNNAVYVEYVSGASRWEMYQVKC